MTGVGTPALCEAYSFAKAIAAAAGHVYWTDADLNSLDTPTRGRVCRCAIDGGIANVLAESAGLTGALQIREGVVVWISAGALHRMDLDGTNQRILAQTPAPVGLALHGTRCFFSDTRAGTVNTVPLTGGDVAALATGLKSPVSIAVGDRYIAFSEWLSESPRQDRVSRLSLDGGPPTPVATEQTQPRNLVIDGTDVYWVGGGGATNKKGDALYRAPLAGGPTTCILSVPEGEQLHFCLGEEWIYWSSSGLRGRNSGVIGRTLKERDASEVLVSGQDWPDRIARGGNWICWLNADPGRVYSKRVRE